MKAIAIDIGFDFMGLRLFFHRHLALLPSCVPQMLFLKITHNE